MRLFENYTKVFKQTTNKSSLFGNEFSGVNYSKQLVKPDDFNNTYYIYVSFKMEEPIDYKNIKYVMYEGECYELLEVKNSVGGREVGIITNVGRPSHLTDVFLDECEVLMASNDEYLLLNNTYILHLTYELEYII